MKPNTQCYCNTKMKRIKSSIKESLKLVVKPPIPTQTISRSHIIYFVDGWDQPFLATFCQALHENRVLTI